MCSAFLYVLRSVILHSAASSIVGYFILLSDVLIFVTMAANFVMKFVPFFIEFRETLWAATAQSV